MCTPSICSTLPLQIWYAGFSLANIRSAALSRAVFYFAMLMAIVSRLSRTYQPRVKTAALG
jgi:hypothetical protein